MIEEHDGFSSVASLLGRVCVGDDDGGSSCSEGAFEEVEEDAGGLFFGLSAIKAVHS